MISVEEARTRIIQGLRATTAQVVPLPEAWNRVTAKPILARLSQPPQDVSAMDGYALRAKDGSRDAKLRVIGSAPAGHPFQGCVGPSEAVRIFTGSIVPQGADAILLQEDARTEGDAVVVQESVTQARHIRRAGQDFLAGDEVVPAGKRLTARDIGLAAAANHPWIVVHHRPRIAILATGDEITLPGEPIPPGGIVSSNAHALAAIVQAASGEPIVLPIARDDSEAIAAAADAIATTDLLVTTGGASVGEHDLVMSGLRARGLELDFWKIAMRPGKPLMYGRLGSVPVLGLPGNPVSALVCAILFLLPAVGRLSGLTAEPVSVTRAILGAAVKENDQRADYLRATLEWREGHAVVTPFPVQDSAMLRNLARAGALVIRSPHAPALQGGAQVDVIRLDFLGV